MNLKHFFDFLQDHQVIRIVRIKTWGVYDCNDFGAKLKAAWLQAPTHWDANRRHIRIAELSGELESDS